MTLFEKQVQFANKISVLIPWINSITFNGQHVAVTLGDGNIDSQRKVRIESSIIQARFEKFNIKITGNLPSTFTFIKCRDLNHLETGCHYKRLAQDLNLFVGGKWITMSEESEVKIYLPLWQSIGDFWKKQDSLARWGGDFDIRDFNHFSFEHEGVA